MFLRKTLTLKDPKARLEKTVERGGVCSIEYATAQNFRNDKAQPLSAGLNYLGSPSWSEGINWFAP